MMCRWIVFSARWGQAKVWAWCLHTGNAGFDEVRFTATDGMTPVDLPEGADVDMLSMLFVADADMVGMPR